MIHQHYPPKHKEPQFHCIHCNVFAAQYWRELLYRTPTSPSLTINKDMEYCVCVHCGKWSYWFQGKMVIPADVPVPPPHPDMPEVCLQEYAEARAVFLMSPRASAALLRLALQKLLTVLGESGKNINDDISSLIKKGLPVIVQQALDVCRVVGNNAVHPGELDLNDTPDVAQSIFNMMNFIVEDRITRPKEIQDLYLQLPEGARKAIKARDGKVT